MNISSKELTQHIASNEKSWLGESKSKTIQLVSEKEKIKVEENPIKDFNAGPEWIVTSSKFFDNPKELALFLKEYYDKYIKYIKEEKIVHIKLNVSKEAYLTLFRTRKPNSKTLVEFYKSEAWNFYIKNHDANRLWNNSAEGKMTQLRLVLEGMIGIANISGAPGGFTINNKDSKGVLSIIDKGNWTVFQNLAFELTDPANDIQVHRFMATELLSVLRNSQMFKKTPIIEELIDRIEDAGVFGVRMTLKQWFNKIDRYDLIENYLESPFTLTILVGPEELYLKEMIDENNIFNQWTTINFFLSKWLMDGTSDTDLHQLLNKIYKGEVDKWKVVRRVLTENRPGTELLRKVRGLSKSCREFVLFPAIALEIVRNNSDFETKDVYKLFDKYDAIDKKIGWEKNDLILTYDKYVANKKYDFKLEDAYDFIHKFFDDEKIKDWTKKIESTFKKLAKSIDDFEDAKLSSSNPKSMGFSTKGNEDFQFMILSMIYQILQPKQSIKKEHILHILSVMHREIEGCFTIDKKTKSIDCASTDIGTKMSDMIKKGCSGYSHKAPFLDELQFLLEEDFDRVFGSSSKNTKFKKQEIDNLLFLLNESGWGEVKLKFIFINKSGNIKRFDEDVYKSMDWRHIKAGVDKYWSGVLWLGETNKANGAMDDMILTSKKETYTKLYEWMVKNEDSYQQIKKSDIAAWEAILNEWDKHFNENLEKLEM